MALAPRNEEVVLLRERTGRLRELAVGIDELVLWLHKYMFSVVFQSANFDKGETYAGQSLLNCMSTSLARS